MSDTERLLTTSEVAETFQVTARTVGRWVRDGLVRAVRVPGTKGYRFRRADVEALIATQPTEAAS